MSITTWWFVTVNPDDSSLSNDDTLFSIISCYDRSAVDWGISSDFFPSPCEQRIWHLTRTRWRASSIFSLTVRRCCTMLIYGTVLWVDSTTYCSPLRHTVLRGVKYMYYCTVQYCRSLSLRTVYSRQSYKGVRSKGLSPQREWSVRISLKRIVPGAVLVLVLCTWYLYKLYKYCSRSSC